MDYFVWDVDREIFSVGMITLRYYGLFFTLSIIFSLHYAQWIYFRGFPEKKGDDTHVSGAFIYIFFGSIIGARLGHMFFYEPEFLFTDPLKVFRIWEGGLASHGGTIGILVATYLYVKRKRPPYNVMWAADNMAPAMAMAAFLIRMGNFFNSEILGRQSDVPWAVVFAKVDLIPRHPAVLYEAFGYLALAVFLHMRALKYGPMLSPGRQIGLMFIATFSLRFVLENFKLNQVGFESGMLLNMGQLLSLPFIFAGMYCFWYQTINEAVRGYFVRQK